MRNDDVFDTAILVSADSDLTGPIDSVLQDHPGKRVVVVSRHAATPSSYRRHATSAFVLRRKLISDSQFPPQIVKSDGFILTKPSRWN